MGCTAPVSLSLHRAEDIVEILRAGGFESILTSKDVIYKYIIVIYKTTKYGIIYFNAGDFSVGTVPLHTFAVSIYAAPAGYKKACRFRA